MLSQFKFLPTNLNVQAGRNSALATLLAPGRTYIPKTGYFHDKTKIFKGKSPSALFNAKNVAESNVP